MCCAAEAAGAMWHMTVVPTDYSFWLEQGMDPSHANFLHHNCKSKSHAPGMKHASECMHMRFNKCVSLMQLEPASCCHIDLLCKLLEQRPSMDGWCMLRDAAL